MMDIMPMSHIGLSMDAKNVYLSMGESVSFFAKF